MENKLVNEKAFGNEEPKTPNLKGKDCYERNVCEQFRIEFQ